MIIRLLVLLESGKTGGVFSVEHILVEYQSLTDMLHFLMYLKYYRAMHHVHCSHVLQSDAGIIIIIVHAMCGDFAFILPEKITEATIIGVIQYHEKGGLYKFTLELTA